MAGVASATIFATPLRYTACITENLEKSPWESLALSKGYAPTDNVITCAMVESPRQSFDDESDEPVRLLTGIADSMVAMGSWNMHARSDMVVAMGPQHAAICARAGMSRADVHAWLVAHAGRRVRDLKGGGNFRPERVRAMAPYAPSAQLDPDNDDCFIPAIKTAEDLQLIVAGGWGPCTAICHGWSGGSKAVHGTYDLP